MVIWQTVSANLCKVATKDFRKNPGYAKGLRRGSQIRTDHTRVSAGLRRVASSILIILYNYNHLKTRLVTALHAARGELGGKTTRPRQPAGGDETGVAGLDLFSFEIIFGGNACTYSRGGFRYLLYY